MEYLKFVPFTSTIHPGFWSQLAKVKLEVAGLDEQPMEVRMRSYVVCDFMSV